MKLRHSWPPRRMNICILSKFPPLQGGICAKTYWLARAYAEIGHKVHVISNASLTGRQYKIPGCYPHIRRLENVTLHEVEKELPWHIPDEKHSLARLVDAALNVINCYSINVIDTGYLVPYGIAGYLVNRVVGIPYIVRHGGSDIEKFLRAGRVKNLLNETLANASTIVTDKANRHLFKGLGPRIAVMSPYVPNPEHFYANPQQRSSTVRILVAGKINWHWERKGLGKIAECQQLLPTDWEIIWIGQGKGYARFKKFLKERKLDIVFKPFVPPWEMPEIIRSVDYVYCVRMNEPISSFSNLFMEALSCGATPIVSDEFDINSYDSLLSCAQKTLLRVHADDLRNMALSLRNHNQTVGEMNIKKEAYKEYINGNVAVINKCIYDRE